MSVQTIHAIHFLRPPSPPKRVYINIFEGQNPHENNKNQDKKLKVYGKNFHFHRPPLPPLKVYGLYTLKDVDICGRPLIHLYFCSCNTHKSTTQVLQE